MAAVAPDRIGALRHKQQGVAFMTYIKELKKQDRLIKNRDALKEHIENRIEPALRKGRRRNRQQDVYRKAHQLFTTKEYCEFLKIIIEGF